MNSTHQQFTAELELPEGIEFLQLDDKAKTLRTYIHQKLERLIQRGTVKDLKLSYEGKKMILTIQGDTRQKLNWSVMLQHLLRDGLQSITKKHTKLSVPESF
jgi:hypothetical protein